jgi:sortase (surface protein transpeptidase)
MEWSIAVFVIVGLIFAYGKGKKKIGSLTVKNKKRKGQREREARAKEIESEAPPTDPTDVANAWDSMREHSDPD